MAGKENGVPAATANQEAAGQQTRVKFNTSNLKSSYANVCTVTSTREEVVLNFGINQNWDRGPNELEIELTDRIILSPFAAHRLLGMLNNLMNEYQKRYGEIRQEGQAAASTAAPASETKQ